MVLKCTFSSPQERKEELIACLRMLPPLASDIAQKGTYTTELDREGRISVTILYEFEDNRLMGVSRDIFKRLDAFSGISKFEFSSQVWADSHKAQASLHEGD